MFGGKTGPECVGNPHCGAPMDRSKPSDGVWQTYVPESEAANNLLCRHNTRNGTAEGIGYSRIGTIWPERLQNTLCGFIGEGFTGHGGPPGGRTLLGASYWNGPNEDAVQIRLKWGGKLDHSWKKTA
jgi:hypothetical protein